MLGEQLQRLGHEVLLYAPELGPFADHARRRGLDVVGNARELPATCDVTFAQDGIVVYDLAERYWRIRSRMRGAPGGATLGAPATKETDP
jgi:hypothetical protein